MVPDRFYFRFCFTRILRGDRNTRIRTLSIPGNSIRMGELLKPYVSSDGTGVELVAMPNEKLKWQQTDTWNLALELGVLKGRITARAEYFQKLTKNSLTQITLAPSLGFASYPENMGTLENKESN